jgi:hypothetical protein
VRTTASSPLADERRVPGDAVRRADGDPVQRLDDVRLPTPVRPTSTVTPGQVELSAAVGAEVDELEALDPQRVSAHPHRHEQVGQVVDLTVLRAA